MPAYPKMQELYKGKVYKKGKLTIFKKTCLFKKPFWLFHLFNFLKKIRSDITVIAVQRTTFEKLFQLNLYKS